MRNILLSFLTLLSFTHICAARAVNYEALYGEGVDLYNSGRYADAAEIFTQLYDLESADTTLPEVHTVYDLHWLASCYHKLGDDDTALSINPESYYLVPVDRRLTAQSDSLSALAEPLYGVNPIEARELVLRCAELEKKNLGPDHYYYANSLTIAGRLSMSLREFEAAIDYFEKALGIYERAMGTDNDLWIPTMCAYTEALIANGDVAIERKESALRAIESALETAERTGSQYLPDCMMDKASVLLVLGQGKDAINLANQALDKCEEAFGVYSETYINLSEIAFSLFNIAGEYDTIYQYRLKQYNAIRATESKPEERAVSAANLADACMSISSQDEAEKYILEAFSLADQCSNFEDYPIVLENLHFNLSTIYEGRYEYEKAEKELIQAYRALEKYIDVYPYEYANVLVSLGEFYMSVGRHLQAVEILSKARAFILQQRNPQKDFILTVDYELLMALSNAPYSPELSKLYGQLSQEYFETIFPIFQRFGNNDNQDTMSALVGSGFSIYTLFNHIKECTHIMLFDARAQIAAGVDIFAYRKDFDKNFTPFLMQISVCEDMPHLKAPLANIYESMSLIYGLFDENEKSTYYIDKAIALKEELGMRLTTDESIYQVLKYAENSKFEEKEAWYRSVFEGMVADIRRQFSWMTAEERSDVLSTYNYGFNTIPNILWLCPENEVAKTTAYDASLLRKGILLNTEREFTTLLEAAEAESIAPIYRQWQSMRRTLANQSKPDDRLAAKADSLEKVLVAQSREFGDFTRNLGIRTSDVRRALKPTDAAIEFISFSPTTDSLVYCALVLTPDMDVPKLVPLFEKRQLDAIAPGELYSDTRLTQLIWTPLEPILENVEDVYFAPDGELYNIAIENLPYDADTYIGDNRRYHRLSSTRELAIGYDNYGNSTTALFGGIDFDAPFASEPPTAKPAATPTVGQRERSAVRVSYDILDPLPGTLSETEAIAATLEFSGLTPFKFTGANATEDAFKRLSGNRTNLIHIATHGFYEPSITNGGNTEAPLSRSGLMFAGANNSLMGTRPTEGIDDGILTAHEIASLDLRGLELVVLSACQTGLGEISGEGVFGLQRGFKKAGAHSIVMSLWKVDDDATSMLMTHFYSRLNTSASPHQALEDSRRYVRDYTADDGSRPYAEPQYWAAFVLLD